MGNNQVCFDSDSYPVGIDNHASRCMVNSPHLFEDLKLSDSEGEVDVISEGLAIKGMGTFKFVLMDDDDKAHIICIKNSLYLPGLKCCLLSLQHWAQEAGDNETWMGNFARCCILHWGEDFMKTVPFNPSMNMPVLCIHYYVQGLQSQLLSTRDGPQAPWVQASKGGQGGQH
jgi:hypothetical protein